MKQILYLVILVPVAIVIFLGLTSSDYPIDMEVLGIMLWIVSPYFYLMIMSKFVSKDGAVKALLVLALFVGIFGVWATIDPIILRVETDKVSFVFPPSWQWALLLIATPAIYFFNRERNA